MIKKRIQCSLCDGSGQIRVVEYDSETKTHNSVEKECYCCDGSGYREIYEYELWEKILIKLGRSMLVLFFGAVLYFLYIFIRWFLSRYGSGTLSLVIVIIIIAAIYGLLRGK